MRTMTARERFHATLAYSPVDRFPLWDEGIRDDVREAWSAQGLPRSEALSDHFTYDRREDVSIDLHARPPFNDPRDEPEVFVRLRSHYQPDASRIPADWSDRVIRWADRDWTLGMSVWRGLFQSLGVGEWSSLKRTLLALADVPSVMARTLAAIADCTAQTIERCLEGVVLDYAVFDEPIAGAYGSVISPSYFRRFCQPYYRRLVDMLETRGVQWFIVRTYGNPVRLLPSWIDCGINVFWCTEGGHAGVDYSELRATYGRKLRLIGGIDIRSVRRGGRTARSAIERSVPPLLADGGYIPLADGRLRPDVPWKSYRDYRTELEKLAFQRSNGAR